MANQDHRRRRGAKLGSALPVVLVAALTLGVASAWGASTVDYNPTRSQPRMIITGDLGVNDIETYKIPITEPPPGESRKHINVRDRSGITENPETAGTPGVDPLTYPQGYCQPSPKDAPRNQECLNALTALTAGRSALRILLGGGDDVLNHVLSRQATIDGGEGNDTIAGSSRGGAAGGGGTAGDKGDSIKGGPGNDSLHGRADNDLIDGGDGNDTIRANGPDSGIDKITCGPGDDSVAYDLGLDVLVDSAQCELKNGSEPEVPENELPPPPVARGETPPAPAGTSLSSVPTAIQPQTSRARATACVNVVRGTRRSDLIRGVAPGERLFGLRGDDRISGGAGDDCLVGGPGNDRLWGAAGNDGLAGTSGRDRLHGGAGRDRFLAGSGNDYVVARDRVKETVNCGPGRDIAKVDRADVVVGCETIIRR